MPFCHQSWRGINWRYVCVRWSLGLFISSPSDLVGETFWLISPTNFFFLFFLIIYSSIVAYFLYIATTTKLQISWKFTGLEKFSRHRSSGGTFRDWVGPRFPLGLLKGKKREKERKTFWVISALTTATTIYTPWIYYYSVHIFLISNIYIYIFFLFLCVGVCVWPCRNR